MGQHIFPSSSLNSRLSAYQDLIVCMLQLLPNQTFGKAEGENSGDFFLISITMLDSIVRLTLYIELTPDSAYFKFMFSIFRFYKVLVFF